MAETKQPLVQEARAGEPAAWDALFKRYQLPIYVYVFELVHHEQTSLDIVQETFIAAVRHIDGLRDDDKFASWLFGIAHQKCIQDWRKRSKEQIWLDDSSEQAFDELPDADDNPRDWLIRQEQEKEFMSVLNELPLPQRSVFLLHFVEEFSLENIAAITGTQLGTVKSRMHYAKKALRKLIEEKS